MPTDNARVEIANRTSPVADIQAQDGKVGRIGLTEGLARQQAISASSQSRKARIFGTLRRASG